MIRPEPAVVGAAAEQTSGSEGGRSREPDARPGPSARDEGGTNQHGAASERGTQHAEVGAQQAASGAQPAEAGQPAAAGAQQPQAAQPAAAGARQAEPESHRSGMAEAGPATAHGGTVSAPRSSEPAAAARAPSGAASPQVPASTGASPSVGGGQAPPASGSAPSQAAGRAEGGSEQRSGTGGSPAETGTAPRPPLFGARDPQARAQRIARALVSDIVAYHPKRREECLAAGTLRTEFREEIMKSWEEYVAQVGLDVAKSTPYFRNALNEILAKGQRVF